MAKKKRTEVIRLSDMHEESANHYRGLSPEEKLARAAKDYEAGLMVLEKKLSHVSKKGLKRLLISALQIPEEKMVVEFSSDTEEFCFGVVQRVLMGKFSLIYNSILQEKRNKQMVEEDLFKKENMKKKGGKNESNNR